MLSSYTLKFFFGLSSIDVYCSLAYTVLMGIVQEYIALKDISSNRLSNSRELSNDI